jgi:hypothetical protein
MPVNSFDPKTRLHNRALRGPSALQDEKVGVIL